MVCTSCMTYNHAPYIVDAMNGFTMQETTFPVYYLITDDASTDGEPEVIKQYLADHFQSPYRTEDTDDYYLICAVHKTNPNCNFIVFFLKYNHYSIKKSKLPYQAEWRDNAKYIALCEGDDYWTHPRKLQMQYDFLETHPDYSMCCHNAIKLFMDTNTVRTFNEGIPTGVLTPGQIVDKWIIPTASMFYRIENLQYPEWLAKIYSGDMALYLRCMNNGRIFYSDSLMSVYRYSTKGMTASSRMKGKEIFIKEQQTMLLESFNKGTNYRFDDVVGKKIKENYSFINYLKTINKSAILGYFTPYFIGKVINKIARIIKKK